MMMALLPLHPPPPPLPPRLTATVTPLVEDVVVVEDLTLAAEVLEDR